MEKDVPEKEGNLQENEERKVATTVRLFESDLRIFQQELPGEMSSVVRNFTHDFLRVNGYREKDLITQKIELQEQVREITGKIMTIDMQLGTLLTEKYKEQEDLLDREKQELFIAKIVHNMAQTLAATRYKDQFLAIPKKRTFTTDLNWVKSRMKDLKAIPGFSKKPEELLDDMEKIIAKNQKQWEVQWDKEAGIS